MVKQEKIYYTVPEISKILNKKKRAIQQDCKDGKYKSAIQQGGRREWLVLQEEIDLINTPQNNNINRETILKKSWT